MGARTRQQPRAWWRAFLLALILTLAAPVLAQDSAEDDVGVLAGMLQNLLSDAGREVRIRGFQGALSSRATIEELSIADDVGVWLTLTDVVLDWNRADLLSGRVTVNELSAGLIVVDRLPQAQSSGPDLPSSTAREFNLPELPVSVQIGLVRAGSVQLGEAVIGEPAAFTLTGSAQLHDRQGTAQFDAHRTDGTEGSFAFQGGFNNETRILSMNLDFREGPGGIVTSLLDVPGSPALGLRVAGEGPISTFGAEIGLSTDGVPRITGQFALVDDTPETGLLQGGGFVLDISGDLRPLLAEDMHPFFGAESRLRATGQRAENGDLALPELSIVTNALRLEGSADIAASGMPRRVRLEGGIASDDGTPVVLPGSAGGAQIHDAVLHINYDETVSRDWTLRAAVQGIDLAQMTIDSAGIEARGRLNATEPNADPATAAPVFEGVFDYAAQGIQAHEPAVQRAVGSAIYGLMSLSWPGNGAPVELNGFALEGETVSLTAHGEIEGLDFTGFAEMDVPDLAAFSGLAKRPLGGRALISIEGAVNPLTGAMDLGAALTATDLSVGIDEADAFLAGASRIAVSLRRDTEGTDLRDLTVVAGTAELSAHGRLEPQRRDITAQLALSDLSRLGEGYGGQLALDARLVTEAGGDRLQLDGTVADIALADLPAASVIGGMFTGTNRLVADLLLAGETTQVTEATLTGPRLSLSAEGRYSAAAPDLEVTLGRLDVAALAPGGRGTLSGHARMNGAGGTVHYGLSLLGSGPLATGISAVDGLIGTGLTLEAGLTTTPDGALTIDAARLAAQGIEARVTGRQEAGGAARFALDGTISNLAALVPGIAGRATLTARAARAEGATSYDVEAQLAGPSELNAQLRGQVAEDLTLALTLGGSVDSVILNPTLEPASVSGILRFNGTMNGPPRLSSLHASVRMEGGRYVLPAAGVALSEINGTSEMTGLTARINVTMRSLTGGTGALEGTMQLDGALQSDLTARVEELVVRVPRLFDASVSGAVRLQGSLSRGPLVSGTVHVNQAEISIPNSPLARQGFNLAGLSHVGESGASHTTRVNAGIASGTRVGAAPVPMRLDLTLDAPGRVFVRGRGLDAELGGQLRLGGTTRTVVPAGSFGLIRGRLDLLGNRFTLTDGSASMIGSFMPYVSLTATTESDGVTTAVTLSGQADSPEITFSSVPELPQDEVLARLIFGRALSSLSPFQAAQLALSVATLTGHADNSVLSRTREAMGLEDLDFTVTDSGETSLRAGRHLSERVYTDVSVDSEGQSEVTLRLDLSSSVTLQGRVDSDGSTGVGLFFERDY